MKDYIIVWYDNFTTDFNNDNYADIAKSEAVKKFYRNHDNNAVIINIIEL